MVLFLKKLLDFCNTKIYNQLCNTKAKGDDGMSPRTGRPTDNPKGKPLTIRLDNESQEILDDYCKQEMVNKGEAVRIGIKKLKHDIKK